MLPQCVTIHEIAMPANHPLFVKNKDFFILTGYVKLPNSHVAIHDAI